MRRITVLSILFISSGCAEKSSDAGEDTGGAPSTDTGDETNTDTGEEANTDSGDDTDTDSIQLGDFHEGGVVFYVDESGFGLIASVTDLGVADWATLYAVVPDAYNEAIGGGEDNTNNAINHMGSTGAYAVHLTYNATDRGQSDWYLPSKDELWELMLNKEIVDESSLLNGGEPLVSGAFYWSSTQTISDPRYVYGAYSEMWDTSGNSVGPYAATNSKNEGMYVRAIRTFVTD